MKVAQDKHESYADKNRTPRVCKVGDHVYL
jgi:hypothetical protein